MVVSRSSDTPQKATTFQQADLNDLKRAKKLLEKPGISARILNVVGNAMNIALKILPYRWNATIGKITQVGLSKAIHAAIYTMKDKPGKESSNVWHKLAVAATGGFCGFFGLPALAVELPISTTIMLRSIADVARSEGEFINAIDTKIACVEVFALGGPKKNDDASESGYFAIRAALAQSVSKASQYIAEKGLAKESAPAIVRFIMQIAERFSIRISTKAALQAVPTIGAVGGAVINMMFIAHYQNIARGHFIIRRLEKKYGTEIVRTTYKTI
jgi:EcsC protein family